MTAYIFIGVCVLIFIALHFNKKVDRFGLYVISGTLLLFYVLFSFMINEVYYSRCAIIKEQNNLISMMEQELKSFEQRFEDFDPAIVKNVALVNNDIPVASFMSEYMKLKKEIVSAKKELNEAYKTEYSMKLNPFYKIFIFEYCEQ